MVPVPNSTPQVKNSTSSGHALANALVEAGLGQEVLPLIERYKPCRKASSGFTQDTRPSVADHMATLRAPSELLLYSQIVLVDDVLTMGTTSTACRLILEREFPGIWHPYGCIPAQLVGDQAPSSSKTLIVSV